MHHPLLLAVALAFVVSSGETAAGVADLWQQYRLSEDPAELKRTWEHAEIHVPGHLIGPDVPAIYGAMSADYVQRRLGTLPPHTQIPLVVFMHGCAGIGPIEHKLSEVVGNAGYAMITSDSFARNIRERNCNYQTYAAGMFPAAYLYRRAEIVYTVRRARALPWVDPHRIILAGFSEGAVATALWGNEVDVNAYIVAGWTCTAPPEYRWLIGLRTPFNRPVLAIVSHRDPWFNWPGWLGDCGSMAPNHSRVRSLIIDGSVHNVFAYPEVIEAVIAFLREALDD